MSKDNNSSFDHKPLPYIIYLKIVASEDLPPETRPFRITAYSVYEAMLQAILSTGNDPEQIFGGESKKVNVVSLGPDIERYWKMYPPIQTMM